MVQPAQWIQDAIHGEDKGKHTCPFKESPAKPLLIGKRPGFDLEGTYADPQTPLLRKRQGL